MQKRTAAVVFALSVNLSCSGEPEADSDPPIVITLDAGMDAESGDADVDPIPDSGTSDLGGGEDASEPDLGDLVNPQVCDPVLQDCVEPEASKCELRFDGEFSFTCFEPTGDVPEGEACSINDDELGSDDCGAGSICTGFSSPEAPRTRRCRQFCSPEVDCEDPARACAVLERSSFGICHPSCDPVDDSCGEGVMCADFLGLEDRMEWVCFTEGTLPDGDECELTRECSKGSGCFDGISDTLIKRCRPVCTEDADCSDTAGCFVIDAEVSPFGPCLDTDWSCVGSVTVATPTEADAMVELVVSDIGSGSAIDGATVNVCARDDADCTSPLGTATTSVGRATVTVPLGTDGFDGYFEILDDTHAETLHYPGLPIVDAAAGPIRVRLFPADLAARWYPDPPVSIDTTRGLVLAAVEDCAPRTVAVPNGARVTMAASTADASTTTGYSRGFALDTLSVSFDAGRTDTSSVAFAAAANVPTGSTDLTFTRKDGTVVASRTVLVRAGAMTSVDVEPTP